MFQYSNNNIKSVKLNINYDPSEPAFDEYVFCNNCTEYVFKYCSIHGPLLVIPDEKVPAKPSVPTIVPRAALTIPNTFVHLARSTIPGAGIGVFSTISLPRGVRFGPYQGLQTNGINSAYCWQIYDKNKRPSHVIDAMDANRSNWMRYVNCSRHWSEQNLIAYQYQGQIYYRTIKTIPKFTELLVFYGSEFANTLNINLKKYNDDTFYKYVIKKISDEGW
ncbi:histone-lysine N-methyltransferase PRDM7-like [Epargyreus clarus]|uniref:histone-lysine N-methyltransferase PRDM7-like n=1 Tax=Epargyreus clarus TaxID=520877 RepID=UPI003C2E6308